MSRCESSAAGSGVASSEAAEAMWAGEEDRAAASAMRDSASCSDMKVSEKMTSYWIGSAGVGESPCFGGVPHLWVCEEIVSHAEHVRAAACYAGSHQPYESALHLDMAMKHQAEWKLKVASI